MTAAAPGRRTEQGYSIVDLMVAVTLLSLVLIVVYQVFIPAFALSRNTDERLNRQQDVRLALDRLARDMHESTAALGRLRVYSPGMGCTGSYEGCIGFVTARDGCTGDFALIGGSPNWQATIYVWRDVAANELRRRCDTPPSPVFPVFPVTAWPPPTLAPYTVMGREIVAAAITPVANGVQINLRERAVTAAGSSRRYQTEFYNQTVFVPLNR